MPKSQDLGKFKTWVEIDKKALINNIKIVRRIIGDNSSDRQASKKIIAVVKSNAYGHGLVECSKIFLKNGANWLGVDSIDEAVALKKRGIKAPILILGFTTGNNLIDIVKNDLRQVVYDLATVKKLGELAGRFKKIIRVHLKIETGTNRQGVLPEEIPGFISLFSDYPFLKLEGVLTHFANIEDTDNHSFANEQFRKFNEAIDLFNVLKIRPSFFHTASSAAVLFFPETYFNLVRPGIILYGLWTSERNRLFAEKRGINIDLKSALTWKTRVAQIKKVPKGSFIGYGLTEKVERDSKIAVLPVGYWDGYDRKLSSVGEVLLKGKRAKVLGRICMNMIMIDVTDIPTVKAEDEIVLLGKQGQEEIKAEELAGKIGTINYEVVTRINPLIPRIYI
ncbi:MAG: alanine racemase [Parcubacteria group bacterium]|nr:alanine racemase [Parcubacteria group bacterium]